MRQLELSQHEQLLLHAALNPDGAVAAASWQAWASQVPLEQASLPELRLLPAAYAHLYRVAPTLELPRKLRGNVRANFCRTTFLADESLPIIQQLSRGTPVMLTKGMAICLRFKAWASRPMWDVDVHVPFQALDQACQMLAQFGWTPRYGLTWDSLVHRSCLRRNSWNFTKGLADVDLHWRLPGDRDDRWLEKEMWETSEQVEYSGQRLLVQSAEFAVISSVHHGFLQGTRSDALQTTVDAAWLLPLCRPEILLQLVRKSELSEPFQRLIEILDGVGASPPGASVAKLMTASQSSHAKQERLPVKPTTERAMLRHPSLYRLWTILGRKSRLERLLLKCTGPFSKPLKSAPARQEYDMRECTTIDAIGGPGWSWPEPARSCIWSDRADVRLLIPLKHVDDHLIVLDFTDQQRTSPNGRIDVFANGLYVTEIDISRNAAAASTSCCLGVTRRMLFGPWVELAFRPRPYRRDAAEYYRGLGLALRKISVLELRDLNAIFGGHNPPQLHIRLLRGEEPYASKLARIQAKIEASPHKGSSDLPEDFDPLVYVLSYSDLFEAEVDPYQHFIGSGRFENRIWR